MSSVADSPSSSNFREIEDRYTIGQVIGKGAFSTVSECHCHESGETFAVKIVPKSNSSDSDAILSELATLRLCDHSNIVKFVDYFESDSAFNIIMAKADAGDLFSRVVDNGSLSEETSHHFFYQILEGVKHLHSLRITHRDLKLENCLMTSDDQLMISDLGFSVVFDDSEKQIMTTCCGSPSYAAPEILLGEFYTPAVDIWSMGVILYTMFFGVFPYAVATHDVQRSYEKILNDELSFPEDKNASPELTDLIRKMLEPDLTKRFTLDQISAHSWMAKFTPPVFACTSASSSAESTPTSSPTSSSSSSPYATIRAAAHLKEVNRIRSSPDSSTDSNSSTSDI